MPSPPSHEQFVEACKRSFHYLEERYGFTLEPVEPAVESHGYLGPFLVRFQGPGLALVIEGISFGYGTMVLLEPLHGPRLNVDWLLDQRRPGWRRHFRDPGQLGQIQGYAAALLEVADDLLSGDLSALPGLLAARDDFLRRAEIEAQREQAAQWIQDQVRPRNLLEQRQIAQAIRFSLGLLRAETKVLRALRKKRGTDGAAVSWDRLAESWRATEERLELERSQSVFLSASGASNWVQEGLRSLLAQMVRLRAAIDGADLGQAREEEFDALDRQSQELDLALAALGQQLTREMDQRDPG